MKNVYKSMLYRVLRNLFFGIFLFTKTFTSCPCHNAIATLPQKLRHAAVNSAEFASPDTRLTCLGIAPLPAKL